MTHEEKAKELQEHYDMLDAQEYYYGTYLKDWKKNHSGELYQGMEPVCFAEFYDNEWQDLKEGQ